MLTRLMGLVAGDFCLRDSSHDTYIHPGPAPLNCLRVLEPVFQYCSLPLHYKDSCLEFLLLLAFLGLPPGVSHIPVQSKASCSPLAVLEDKTC